MRLLKKLNQTARKSKLRLLLRKPLMIHKIKVIIYNEIKIKKKDTSGQVTKIKKMKKMAKN